MRFLTLLKDKLLRRDSPLSSERSALSVGFLFRGEEDWSTTTKKVTPRIATTGEAQMLVITPARLSVLFWARLLLPTDVKFVSLGQFGATPQMGVTFASHTLRLHGHSSAVLYLDLSKTFNFVIREAILGPP